MSFNPDFTNMFQNSQTPGTPVPGSLAYAQSMQAMNQRIGLRSNRILVTSLNEALTKPCDYGSEMYYWDQSRPVIYIVRTNLQGVKEWAEIHYIVPAPQATAADRLEGLEKRLSALEIKLSGTNGSVMSDQEVNSDVKPIG